MMMMNRGKEIRDVRVESFDFEIEFLSLSFVISPYLHLGRYGYSKGIQNVGEQGQGKKTRLDLGLDWIGIGM